MAITFGVNVGLFRAMLTAAEDASKPRVLAPRLGVDKNLLGKRRLRSRRDCLVQYDVLKMCLQHA